MDEGYEVVTEEGLELSEKINKVLEGVESHTAVEGLIVAICDVLADCAYSLENGQAAAHVVGASIAKSLKSMDDAGLCSWSERLN